jgi:two-component system, NtrC family, response regulator AtoC
VVAPTGDLDARDAWIVVVSGALGIVRRAIAPGRPIVLGRGDDVDLVVHDSSISRRHARIWAGDPARIEDLGSRNGTHVAGRRLALGEIATLPVGSVAEIGSAFFVLYRGAIAGDGAAPGASASPASEPLVIDEAMRQIYAQLDTVAPSSLSVLVLGETGTGKEIYARALHARSSRAAQVFVSLNCATLTEALLESELFGHDKGAFTGAVAAKPGLFELADGGTLLLDEIGDLPLAIQPKLLRVLETGEVMRVGGLRPRSVDVRVVAATNADLPAAIAAGRFRSDLYYRINGVVVTLPPLRARTAEILPLARQFAAAMARARGHATPVFTPAAERVLRDHAWRGNVRELKGCVQRAVLFTAERGVIDAADFQLEAVAPPGAIDAATTAAAVASANGEAPAGPPSPPHERERILEALQRAHGNQKEAAKLLGYSRQTLAKKLDAHAIGRPRKAVARAMSRRSPG